MLIFKEFFKTQSDKIYIRTHQLTAQNFQNFLMHLAYMPLNLLAYVQL